MKLVLNMKALSRVNSKSLIRLLCFLKGERNADYFSGSFFRRFALELAELK